MRSMRWADIPQLSARDASCPAAWQQCWQQSWRPVLQLLFHVECSSAAFCVTEWRATVVTVSDARGLARRRGQGLTGA